MSEIKSKTVAASFIPLILVSSLFGIYLAFTPTNNTQFPGSPSFTSSTNSTTGLELFLSLNTSSITYESGINVTLGLLNVKNSSLTLNYPGQDWLPIVNGFCLGTANLVILQGYYTMSNLTSVNKTQQLNIFGDLLACPDPGGRLVLPPNAGYVTAPPHVQQVSYALNGYYPSSRGGAPPAVPFSFGTYTVVAGDGWGQLVITHFKVVSRPFSSSIVNSSSFTIGSAHFSTSSWKYAGNVTLAGSESTCDILRIPCPNNPQNPAKEFVSDNGTVAYVETVNGCGPQGCMITTIVLIDNSLYCVSPKSNIPSQPECPALIN